MASPVPSWSTFGIKRFNARRAREAARGYDAAYLELALRRRLPLASRDGALNRAATRCEVTALLVTPTATSS